MAHDVFVSYSSRDKTVADAVCARLESRGIRCWIAPRDVTAGSNYGAAIIDAIGESRVMVLVLSAHANASPHIPNEIERAVSKGIAVLPFRIEDVQPAKSLDLFIGSVHWLDALTPPLERHLDQLASSVEHLLGTVKERVVPPPPVPPPVPPPRPILAKVAAAALVVVAGLIWWLWPSAPASQTQVGRPPAVEGAPGTLPPGGGGVGAPAAGDIAGCWRWANNATVVIRGDGSMRVGPFDGQWRHTGGRGYVFQWPEPIDTLTLSPDGQRLEGANQYGVQVTASRVSGGPGIPGEWMWGGVLRVVADQSGGVTMGPLAGSWQLINAGQRAFRVTWPKIQDTITLSDDGSSLQGGNQYGAPVSGTRLASGC